MGLRAKQIILNLGSIHRRFDKGIFENRPSYSAWETHYERQGGIFTINLVQQRVSMANYCRNSQQCALDVSHIYAQCIYILRYDVEISRAITEFPQGLKCGNNHASGAAGGFVYGKWSAALLGLSDNDFSH